MDFKKKPTTIAAQPVATDVTTDVTNDKGIDKALRFLRRDGNQNEPYISLSIDEKRKLIKKIDWMLMPLMFMIFFLQYLDKTLSEIHPLSYEDTSIPYSYFKPTF